MPMIAEGGGPPWVLGSCSPGKLFKICASNMPFPAFWGHGQWKCHTQSYCRLMLGCQKSQNGWETTENRKRIVVKRLVEQRKGTVSKTGRILSENGRFQVKRVGHRACCPRQLDTTYSRLLFGRLSDDNDHYQCLPAEFRNGFNFGNVC